MKIIYVITRSDVMGGASVHLLDLAHGAQQKGHEVSIFVGGNGVFNVVARERGLNCQALCYLKREIDIVSDILCFFELKRKLAEVKPDIVHLHSSKAGLLGRLACRALSIPVIFTAHGWAFTEGVPKLKRKLYLAAERLMAHFSNKIITVSDYDRSLALSLLVGNEGLIKTVHNGMPELTSACVREISLKVSAPRLIMVARFEAPKDHQVLLESLASIKGIPWLLELVGDGPLLSAAEDTAERLGLSDRVIFSGACGDVHRRLANADIFILISQWEGLPLTILEAMRAGLPVIASNVGGVSEAVETGITGFLVDRDDRKAIEVSISRLVLSRELRVAMGESARRKFERDFTFSRMLSATLDVYNDVVKAQS